MDRAAVSAPVDEVAAAWNSHDSRRFASCFAADADFVNVVGAWWKGRDEIEKSHEWLHSGPFKQTRLTLTLQAFKEVAPEIAIAHVGALLEGERVDGLEIVAAQNTDVLSPPRPVASDSS